jgi:hypothetical protein
MRPSLRVLAGFAAVLAATAARADDRIECRDGLAGLRTQIREQRSPKEREELQTTLRKAEGHWIKRRYDECIKEVRSGGRKEEQREETDTGDLFGFTEDTDVMEKGKLELSAEFNGSFERRTGRYQVGALQKKFAFAPADNLNIEVGAFSNGFLIRDVPDMDDRRSLAFGGLSAEFKWQLAKRGESAPFGVALISEPSFLFRDQTSGERGHGFNVETRLAVDTALVPDTLFAAMNLIYEVEKFDPRMAPPERESEIGISGALAFQASQKVAFGGEARYLRSYEGLTLERFQGHAFFLGPTFKATLTEQLSISGTWSVQVAGRSVEAPGRPLDLENFSRHEAKFKISYEF